MRSLLFLLSFKSAGCGSVGCSDDKPKRNSSGDVDAKPVDSETDVGDSPRSDAAKNDADDISPSEEDRVTPLPCNPDTFVMECNQGWLKFCPDSGLVRQTYFDTLPQNDFCIEGFLRECSENGWRLLTEQSEADKEEPIPCGETQEEDPPPPEAREGEGEEPPPAGEGEGVPDVGEGEGEGEGEEIPGEGEGENEINYCDDDVEPGTYRCQEDFLQICREWGWEVAQNCQGGICDADEEACFDVVEREVCLPIETVYFNEDANEDNPGRWNTSARDFTCEPICAGPGEGFPVHSNRNLNATTTARFEVDPINTKLFISFSGEGHANLLRVTVDGIGPIPYNNVGECRETSFILQDPFFNGQSILFDRQVEVSIWSGGPSNNYVGNLWNRDMGEEEREERCEGPILGDARFLATYVPYRVSLTECRNETERIQRE